jgi:RecQ family ATP-dependent DNA helicase
MNTMMAATAADGGHAASPQGSPAAKRMHMAPGAEKNRAVEKSDGEEVVHNSSSAGGSSTPSTVAGVMPREVMECLYGTFQHRELLSGQSEVTRLLLDQPQTHVFWVQATGAGKSLPAQLLGLSYPGITVVIAPLRALINDQVRKLNNVRDGCAVSLDGTISEMDKNGIYASLYDFNTSPIQFVFVTPEYAELSGRFIQLLSFLNAVGQITRIVIDEAHLVTHWGLDWRLAYAELSLLIVRRCAGVQVLCLTATCSRRSAYSVCTVLGLNLDDVRFFFKAGLRQELIFSVMDRCDKKGAPCPPIAPAFIQLLISKLTSGLKGRRGLIFAATRDDVETIYRGFEKSDQLDKQDIGFYHAGLEDEDRREIEQDFQNGRIKVLVCTIAFGLGVDVSDIHFVIHSSMSTSILNYVQESGRAGRDRGASECILFYSPTDINQLMKWQNMMDSPIKRQAILDMARYCQKSTHCRAMQLARTFSETAAPIRLCEVEGSSSQISEEEQRRCLCEVCTATQKAAKRGVPAFQVLDMHTVAVAIVMFIARPPDAVSKSQFTVKQLAEQPQIQDSWQDACTNAAMERLGNAFHLQCFIVQLVLESVLQFSFSSFTKEEREGETFTIIVPYLSLGPGDSWMLVLDRSISITYGVRL